MDQIQLQVGNGHGQTPVDTGLEGWLEQLKDKIDNFGFVSQIQQETITDAPLDYKTVARVLFLHIRDQGQEQLASQVHRLNNTVRQYSKTIGTLPHFELSLGPDEFEQLKQYWIKQQLPLQRYYELQERLSRHIEESKNLEQQWLALPQQLTELPQTRSTLQKLFTTIRESNSSWLSIFRINIEHLWKLRMELVEAYKLLVTDTIREFQREGEQIVGVFHQVIEIINQHIQQLENGDFFQTWTQTNEQYRAFLQSITPLLPPSLHFQQEVDNFLLTCQESDDPCCVKRVKHLLEQLDRVIFALKMSGNSIQNKESTSSNKESTSSNKEWTETQFLLKQTQDELEKLSTKRMSLWAQGNSIKELENLETQQRQLEQTHSSLLDKIAPMRSRLQPVTCSKTEEVLLQLQQWKERLLSQQENCEKEALSFANGRGLQYRARDSAIEETIRALDSLYVTAQQKIDGAGLALVRYGLIVLQQTIASAIVPSHTEQQKQKIAHESLSHYIQRLSLNHPSFAELLHQQSQVEDKIRLVKGMIEEIQLQNYITALLQHQLSSFSLSPSS